MIADPITAINRKYFVLGLQVFSSFHEEMEERRKDEARRQSEGHDKLASIDRQVMFKRHV